MYPPVTAGAEWYVRSLRAAEPCGDLPCSQQPEAFLPSPKGRRVSALSGTSSCMQGKVNPRVHLYKQAPTQGKGNGNLGFLGGLLQI